MKPNQSSSHHTTTDNSTPAHTEFNAPIADDMDTNIQIAPDSDSIIAPNAEHKRLTSKLANQVATYGDANGVEKEKAMRHTRLALVNETISVLSST